MFLPRSTVAPGDIYSKVEGLQFYYCVTVKNKCKGNAALFLKSKLHLTRNSVYILSDCL
jgi:hypothetical protein